MKAVASTTNRRGRGVPKATPTHKGMQPLLPPEYQAIFTKNGRPMVILEADATISLVNAEFERFSGYTKKQIEGNKRWTEFVAMADRKRMREYHLLRKSDPILAPRCFEFQFVDQEGAVKNVVITIGQIPGTNKSMASLMDVTDRRREQDELHRDTKELKERLKEKTGELAKTNKALQGEITKRKGAEAALREAGKRYRDIFDSMLEGYFEVDLAGNFTFFNRAVSKFYGYSRTELMGMNYREFTTPKEAERLLQVFSEIYQTGNPREIDDYEIIKKDGSRGIAEVFASLLRNAAGEPIGFRGVTRDVTEKRKAQQDLHESEEKYRTILETMQEGYWETDLAGNFTYVNDAECRIAGTPKEQLIGTNNLQYTDKTTAKKMYEVFSEIYKTGNAVERFEFEIIRTNGTKGFVECSASLIRDEHGKPIGFRGVTRDITDRKQAEKDLRESEEKYRSMLENIGDAYTETDLSGRITFYNKTVSASLGYTEEEFVGMHYKEYTSPEEAKKIYEIYNKVYKTREPAKSVELEYRAKDGTKRILETTVDVRRDKSGKPIGFKTFTNDITQQRQAEEALRRSEERYRNILASIQEGYFETDLDGNYTFVNDANCRYLGYTREELVGMNYKQHTEEEIVKKLFPHYKELYETGNPIESLEFEGVRKDGTKVIYDTSVTLMRDSTGKPIGFRGVSRDITERKRAEETLRHSEEKYRSILENITEGYFENDLRGNLTFFNDSLPDVYGYTRDELLHMNYRQYMDEENAHKVSLAYNKIYTTGEPERSVQFEIIRKNGTRRWLENSVSLMRDADGQPVGFRGISRDITERKLAEEALHQSEEKYRKILEKMQEGYFEMDLAGNFTLVNDAECKNLGYSREELIGMSNRQYQDEATAKRVFQVYSRIYKTGEPVKALEVEVIRKDGTKVFNETSVSLIRDAHGKPIGFRGLTRDVTERKLMEETLRQSEERYRSILGIIGDAYTETDLAGNMIFINKESFKFLGWSAEEFLGMNYKDYTTPENAKKLFEIYNSVYRTGEAVRLVEYELLAKDGSTKTAEATVELMRDESGKAIGFRTLTRDITQRKQMEEALRQSEERYRTIIENIEDGYYEIDLAGNLTFVNEVVCKNLEYSREELIGTKSGQYQDEAAAKKLREIYNEVYRTGESVAAVESEYIKKDGTKRTYEISASLIRDAQGKPIGFRGISRDVTERKKAEEQLKRYAAELERSNEEVKNFAYIVSHDLRVPLVNLKGYTSELRSALGVIGTHFDAALPHLDEEKRAEVAMALHEDVPEALEFITNAVSRMDGFINAVLILSRLGRRELKPEPLDMEAVVQMSLENLSHQIQEHGIEVTIGPLPEVVADRTAMEQIVGNILGNAVKYIDPERPAKITVTAKPNNTETIFRIRDTGRGIAEDDMYKVFAPFRRAGKQDTPGEGMGLAYVQTLVRRHGGRIWCESEIGKGTTFTFTIATPSRKGVHDA